jgi:hypothetical protein
VAEILVLTVDAVQDRHGESELNRSQASVSPNTIAIMRSARGLRRKPSALGPRRRIAREIATYGRTISVAMKKSEIITVAATTTSSAATTLHAAVCRPLSKLCVPDGDASSVLTSGIPAPSLASEKPPADTSA